MPAVALCELLDTASRSTARFTVSPVAPASRSSEGRELDEICVGDAAPREADEDGPGWTLRARRRCTRPWRSSAATRRDAVLFGGPVVSASARRGLRLGVLDDPHEQLRGPVDGSCTVGALVAGIITWNFNSTT